MKIKLNYQDIDNMTNDEWITYRENLSEEFFKKGGVFKPNVECDACDVGEGYTCLEDEIFQIDEMGTL